ncbi:MAG TPA: SH3 domain-containing protein [Baekduia sp.]|nr:SH3 domain-containing protein [Baekduia sp.]
MALLALAAPASASGKERAVPSRALCRDVTAVRDSPDGYAIGYLFRPQRVTMLHEGVARWALIRSRAGLVGWISEKALCPAARR